MPTGQMEVLKSYQHRHLNNKNKHLSLKNEVKDAKQTASTEKLKPNMGNQ